MAADRRTAPTLHHAIVSELKVPGMKTHTDEVYAKTRITLFISEADRFIKLALLSEFTCAPDPSKLVVHLRDSLDASKAGLSLFFETSAPDFLLSAQQLNEFAEKAAKLIQEQEARREVTKKEPAR